MRTQQEIAGFFRLALQLELIRAQNVIAWADQEILASEIADAKIIDLALSAGKSRDQILLALREVEGWPYYSVGALHQTGALLWRELNQGRLSALQVAKLLYSLTKFGSNDASAVFGPAIFCVEDYFEPYMPSRDHGETQVRRMLRPFANEPLPVALFGDPVSGRPEGALFGLVNINVPLRGDRSTSIECRAMTIPFKPTPADLLAANGKSIPTLIAKDLKVLFCGINPGLWSAATGHHFARPGNRFWPALHAGGFTPRVLKPHEERELLAWGLGITSFVERASATAAELSDAELVEGAANLRRTVLKYRPAVLAILGIGAYRTGFAQKTAAIGQQPKSIGTTRVWVLPNPSGLNAHHTPASLAKLFAALREAI